MIIHWKRNGVTWMVPGVVFVIPSTFVPPVAEGNLWFSFVF